MIIILLDEAKQMDGDAKVKAQVLMLEIHSS